MFKVNSKNTKTKPIDAVAVSFGVNLTAKDSQINAKSIKYF